MYSGRCRGDLIHALEEAIALARIFNHEYVGTEHQLLGLVDIMGPGFDILRGINRDGREVLIPALIRGEILKLVKLGNEILPEDHEIKDTPRAKKVLEYALEEATNMDRFYVGTEHLLLGIFREHEGQASQVLMNLGFPSISHIEDYRKIVKDYHPKGSGICG